MVYVLGIILMGKKSTKLKNNEIDVKVNIGTKMEIDS